MKYVSATDILSDFKKTVDSHFVNSLKNTPIRCILFLKENYMKVEVINEKRLNHIHYCRIHKENNQLSGSFWVPAKSKSKNKKMFSFEAGKTSFVLYDPDHVLKEKITGNTPNECILNLINILINEDMEFLQKLEMKLERIEEQLMSHKGSHYESQIFEMRKTISAFDSYYDQMIEVVQNLQEYYSHFETLEKRLTRLSNVTDRLAEYSIQLREMHQTQVEMRQNQIMQFLTIVTTIFMPLTLITGWYGMNFRAMPELDSAYGYFIVIGVCILIIILEVIYFKKKKWF